MPKRLLILLAGMPLVWYLAWGQSPRAGIDKSGAEKPQRRSGSKNAGNVDQLGSKGFPLVVDTKGHQNTEGEQAEVSAEKDHLRDIERRTLDLASMSAWTNICLTIIGLGGTVAAVLTFRKIKQQTELQTRCIELQERTMQQWVDYDSWNSYREVQEGGLQVLVVEFTIMNRTNFPIRLPNASVIFGMTEQKATWHGRGDWLFLSQKPHHIRV
jgi:hypothetical protein